MKATMKSVRDDKHLANRAAGLHGVPQSTLKDCFSGRIIHGTNPGQKPFLTADEEAELSHYCLQASAVGLGKTRREVKCLVEMYVKERGVHQQWMVGQLSQVKSNAKPSFWLCDCWSKNAGT